MCWGKLVKILIYIYIFLLLLSIQKIFFPLLFSSKDEKIDYVPLWSSKNVTNIGLSIYQKKKKILLIKH